MESAVASAITETEDVKGLPSLPMTGGSAVWMASGVYSVCHVGHIKRRPTRCYRAIPVDSRDGLRAGPLCSAPTVPFALPTLGEAAAAGGL